MLAQGHLLQSQEFQELVAYNLLQTVVGITAAQAKDLLAKMGGIQKLAQASAETLSLVPGIGVKRAAKIKALTQWAVLLNQVKVAEQIQVRSPLDIANMFVYVMENNLTGIYNAVAPEPVTNKEFVRNIAVAQNRPSIFVPVPAFALRAAMGEMAAIVLDSAFVSSEKIQDAGFRFKYPKLGLALKAIYKHS